MTTTVEALKIRMNILQQRDPVANEHIINKIKRRIRLMENKQK